MAAEKAVAQLTQAGLKVWPEENATGPSGYGIAKPAAVRSNHRPGYENALLGLEAGDVPIDAPISYIRSRNGRWCHEVIVHHVTHILTFNTADFTRYTPEGIVAVDPMTV